MEILFNDLQNLYLNGHGHVTLASLSFSSQHVNTREYNVWLALRTTLKYRMHSLILMITKRINIKIFSQFIIGILLITPLQTSGSTTYFEDIKDAWKVEGDADAPDSHRYGWFGWRAVYSNDWERQSGYWQHDAVYYAASTSTHEFTIYWRVGPGGDCPHSKDLEVWYYKYSTSTWIKWYEDDTASEYYCSLFGCETLYYVEDFDFDTMDAAGYIDDLGGGDFEFSFRLKGWGNLLCCSSEAYHIDDQIVFNFQNV